MNTLHRLAWTVVRGIALNMFLWTAICFAVELNGDWLSTIHLTAKDCISIKGILTKLGFAEVSKIETDQGYRYYISTERKTVRDICTFREICIQRAGWEDGVFDLVSDITVTNLLCSIGGEPKLVRLLDGDYSRATNTIHLISKGKLDLRGRPAPNFQVSSLQSISHPTASPKTVYLIFSTAGGAFQMECLVAAESLQYVGFAPIRPTKTDHRR